MTHDSEPPVNPESPDPEPADRPSSPAPRRRWVDWAQGALNGVVGDYLHKRGNDLQIEMTFVHDGQPLSLDADSLARAFPNPGPRVCVFVHGLACTEACWDFPGDAQTSYGSLLRKHSGLVPLYLRYNTGLHISENGAAFAELLNQLTAVWRPELSELVLVGHSMGGLVMRSACNLGDEAGHGWVKRVKKAFYLGSPHLGSPVEKLGNVVSYLLRNTPNSVTQVVADVANLRSNGIKDLRYANLRREDWEGHDDEALLENRRNPVPLLPGISHYLVVGTLTRDENDVISGLFGDALVRVPSAAGQPEPGDCSPCFPPENAKVFPGLAHMTLAHHPDVGAQLAAWCGPGEALTDNGMEVQAQPPPAPAGDTRRLRGLKDLVQDAVAGGTNAVEKVHKEVAATPFSLMELAGPLAAPVQGVRVVHDSVVSGVYASIRLVNQLAGTAIGIALELSKPPSAAEAKGPAADARSVTDEGQAPPAEETPIPKS